MKGKNVIWGVGTFLLLVAAMGSKRPEPPEDLEAVHAAKRAEKLSWLNGPARFMETTPLDECIAHEITDRTAQTIYGLYLYEDANDISKQNIEELSDDIMDKFINVCGGSPQLYYLSMKIGVDTFSRNIMYAMLKKGRT